MSHKIRSFIFAIGSTILLSSAITNAQTPPTSITVDDPPETVFTEEIKLNVSAFDLNGDFVSEVGKDDLVIVEDNRLHQPNSVRRIPANVLIVLDTGGKMRNVKSLSQTRLTASILVNYLAEEDTIAVIEYNDKAKILSEWSSDKKVSLRAINRELNFGKRAVFVDALKLATGFLRKAENENRHLVLITDGTDSFDRTEERAREMRRLMGTNINVHVISYSGLESAKIAPKTKSIMGKPHKNPLPDEVVQGLPTGVKEASLGVNILTLNTDRAFLKVVRKRKKSLDDAGRFLLELSENTSGMYIAPATKSEMVEKAPLIAKIIDSNYVVTYTPKRPFSESPVGEIRSVQVYSRRDGLRISARRKIIVERTN